MANRKFSLIKTATKKKEFTTKENEPWEKEVEVCGMMPTGAKIDSGPLCGVEVFFNACTEECAYFDPVAKAFVPIEDEAIVNCVAADVEECCTEALPERWCTNISGFIRNGNVNSIYNITVDGVETALPASFTNQDILDALEAQGGNYTLSDTGQVCRTDAPFSFVIEGSYAAGEPPDIVLTLFKVLFPALKLPAVEAVCTKYARTYSKREDEIIELLTQMNQGIQNLCAKMDGQVDPNGECPECESLEAIQQRILEVKPVEQKEV